MSGPVHDVLIVGAGFAGIGMAIRLLEKGVKDVVILERGDDVGGTWRDNTYPGAACDVPSILYSYSFAPNPAWSRTYSGSREIQAYFKGIVDRHALWPLIRLRHNVTSVAWDEERGIWSVRVEGEDTLEARTLVVAGGPLSTPSFPDIPELASYEGHKIHSARWDHAYDFAGKRVAVIGTGASAVQIVPELVKQAGRLKVFQRTPGWVLPRPDFATPAPMRALFQRVPRAQKALREAVYWVHESMALGVVWTTPMTRMIERQARGFLRREVKDPWLRRQLTPDYRAGCKRLLLSNDYFASLQAPNCQLVTWPIARIAPRGIRTADGLEHAVDCIVFATGFEVSKKGTHVPITGLGGRELGQAWARGARAHKATSVTGFPNMFFLFGPNSGPGHNSALVYLEAQIRYATKAIAHLFGAGAAYMDVRADVEADHNERLQKRLARTNWNAGGCQSWYLTEDGFNATMYPGFATQFRRQMGRFEPGDYRFV